MSCTRKEFLAAMSAGTALCLAACTPSNTQQTTQQDSDSNDQQPSVDLTEFQSLALDMKSWKYDSANDVYYQLGLTYCKSPVSTAYESLAIFVPGAYFNGEKKGDTYTCTVKEDGAVGNYTAKTAPILMPINSGTLGAQASPTSYDANGLANYMKAGYVYVYAGFRGRSSGYESSKDQVYSGGAPWPVVDLKAAVRYLRYNASDLPCDTSRVFMFGFSAGGGVSALMGSTGDSALYTSYLDSIGAVTHDAQGNTISDAIFGSASWCPLTEYDTADSAYEWMMGQYDTADTRADGTWTKLLSNNLATAYAAYVNSMDLRNSSDAALTLDETSGEIYTDGSYYDYLVTLVQDAAAKFFSTTQFPYTYTPSRISTTAFPGDPNLQKSGSGTQDTDAVTDETSDKVSNATGATGSSNSSATTDGETGATQVQSVVYNSASDYVSALNSDDRWLTYNQRRNTVRISGLRDFVTHLKAPSKKVCAFDAIDRSTTTNQLFGTKDNGTLHFSQMISDSITANVDAYSAASGWDAAYATDWTDDLQKTDDQSSDVATRMNMFNPLYTLSGAYEGFGSCGVAPHWRINSGIFQTDTSLCTEANLALALQHYDGVKDVAFTPVWGQGHVLAEVSGTAEENLLAWVDSCCQQG